MGVTSEPPYAKINSFHTWIQKVVNFLVLNGRFDLLNILCIRNIVDHPVNPNPERAVVDKEVLNRMLPIESTLAQWNTEIKEKDDDFLRFRQSKAKLHDELLEITELCGRFGTLKSPLLVD